MAVLHRYTGTSHTPQWAEVAPETYEEGGTKHVLIGQKDGAANFCMRYYEIPPGGSSSLDEHLHDHGVYILHGTARVLLGDQTEDVGPGDVIYIPPNETHQFHNPGAEPLGFLCTAPPRG